MPKKISEQVIVITGASSGIGLVTAKEAAGRGAKVVLAARNERDLKRAVDEIRRDGGEAIAVPTDVTDFGQVQALADKAIEKYGRIDTWVNNAGVSLYGTFKEIDLDDFKQVVNVILYGNIHGAKVALPHLEQTGGALVCVGSALSDRGVPLQSAYDAAKHAIKGWLDGLRVELAHEGSKVRVTLIKPSSINTPLVNKAKTHLGVVPQPVPPIYEPELAAEAILRAAVSNYRVLFVGGSGRAISLGERMSPDLMDFQMRHSAFKKQKTDWPKSVDAPHNLYEHVEDDGGPRGDFTARSKDHSYYQQASRSRTAPLLGLAAAGLGVAAYLAARSDSK